MSRLTSTFKRLSLPSALVLVVAAAAAVFLLTRQPQIPVTGGTGSPVFVPIEMERGYNLREDQSQYKSEAVIQITGRTSSLVSVPSEVICGYNLKEDQFHCKSDPVIPLTPLIPPTGHQPVICGYNLKEDQFHCKSDPVSLFIPRTGKTSSQFVSTPLEMEPGYNLKVDQSQNK